MRRALLPLLACPRCGGEPAASAGRDPLDEGTLGCPAGHELAVRGGIVDALVDPTPGIRAQIAENERERRGELSAAEAADYRRNISRVGLAAYNQLIRDNARGVLEAIPVRSGASLDLGGGSGWLAEELAGRGFQAVALDIEDPRRRRTLLAEGEGRREYELVTDVGPDDPTRDIDFVLGDMGRLPFRDGAFDLVTMSATLHHAEDPAGTLREGARVLRPGGILLVLNEPAKGLLRDETPILGGRGDHAGEHLYWRRTYLRLLRGAGLEPRLHFPAWVDRRLRERDWQGVLYYHRLHSVAAAMWSLAAVRRLAGGPLLHPLIDLFGLTLIAEARKPVGGDVSPAR